ncbi:VOC family protein [Alienimonas californiensis]|uniref:Glyoxalase-like domain protein n=1 Tax=Alienimonas californiensis TaxID=2527989 RepID=A0A517P607_9PLAN|nr:VOC family protein [Alienimonas californiensis]QDT14814.1 Glyoxalase-like domain protein [Alienimonas californiensis]
MPLRRIFAHLSCSDPSASGAWFAALFNREPDARPMGSLQEWHHGDAAGLQLFENPADAGHGTLTLIVDGLPAERARLEAAGLNPGPIEPANYVRLIRLRDPDGNLVVLAEPQDAAPAGGS